MSLLEGHTFPTSLVDGVSLLTEGQFRDWSQKKSSFAAGSAVTEENSNYLHREFSTPCEMAEKHPPRRFPVALQD